MAGVLWFHAGLWRDVLQDLESVPDLPEQTQENGQS